MGNRPKIINLVLVFFFVFSALGVIPRPVKQQQVIFSFQNMSKGRVIIKRLKYITGQGERLIWQLVLTKLNSISMEIHPWARRLI